VSWAVKSSNVSALDANPRRAGAAAAISAPTHRQRDDLAKRRVGDRRARPDDAQLKRWQRSVLEFFNVL
jgi:hypothetical protein